MGALYKSSSKAATRDAIQPRPSRFLDKHFAFSSKLSTAPEAGQQGGLSGDPGAVLQPSEAKQSGQSG